MVFRVVTWIITVIIDAVPALCPRCAKTPPEGPQAVMTSLLRTGPRGLGSRHSAVAAQRRILQICTAGSTCPCGPLVSSSVLLQESLALRPDKVHQVAVVYHSSFVPGNMKEAVIWELYWNMKTQVAHQRRLHGTKLQKLIRFRREVWSCCPHQGVP